VWAIPFGGADPDFMNELTHSSGGNVLTLDQLDVQFAVPVDLRPIELDIKNVTNDEQATRLKVFEDGRFEALVPLEPGPNMLEIRALLADGHRTIVRRQVHYEAEGAGQQPLQPGSGQEARQSTSHHEVPPAHIGENLESQVHGE
jgi:hypothetical protein